MVSAGPMASARPPIERVQTVEPDGSSLITCADVAAIRSSLASNAAATNVSLTNGIRDHICFASLSNVTVTGVEPAGGVRLHGPGFAVPLHAPPHPLRFAGVDAKTVTSSPGCAGTEHELKQDTYPALVRTRASPVAVPASVMSIDALPLSA